jgi:hypothetical protein
LQSRHTVLTTAFTTPISPSLFDAHTTRTAPTGASTQRVTYVEGPVLTHDWTFDHGLPDPLLQNSELSAWLRLFASADPGPNFPANLHGIQPAVSTFAGLVDHANKFVQHAHDRGICCDYARQQMQSGAGIDTALATRHLQLIQMHGAVAACGITQELHQHNYIQAELIKDECASFPEFDTLLALAEGGAHIATPEGWAPNHGRNVSVRPNAIRMAAPVHVRFAQEQALGDVMLVEAAAFRDYATATSTDFSVISVDWVFKPGNKPSDLLGRLIDDYTNCDAPLNTADTFTAMEAVYGELHLPQLQDMCRSLLLARERFPGQPLCGLKEDISRAYRRVRLAPTSCLKMVLELPPTEDGVSYYAIRLSQPFGHNASAHGWGVVARSIEFQLGSITLPVPASGLFGMYVDDLYAFAPAGYLRLLSDRFAHAARVAGDGARAIEKSDISSVFQSLGWLFCDALDAVMPNTKGWMNMLSLFFSVLPWSIQPGHRIPVVTLLRAGSYASRYSNAFFAMRPFCHGFYGNIRGASPFATRAVSVRTVHDIAVWRFFLCMAYHRPAILSVPITWPCRMAANPETQARLADRVAYVDAALSHNLCGAYIQGVAWCQYECPVTTHFVGGVRVPVSINVLEMLGVLVGVIIALDSDHTITHLHVWCDNTTSVAWADTNRTNSPLSSFLLQLLTLLGASRRVLITVGWIEGVRNVMADAISRRFQVSNGIALQSGLLADSTCPHSQMPQAFSTAISAVSVMLRNETSTTIRCVHTVMAGVSTSGSAPSLG